MNNSAKNSIKSAVRPSGGPGPSSLMKAAEKPKNFKKTLKKLLIFMKPYILPLLLAIIFSVISVIISIISPKIMQKINEILISSGTNHTQILLMDIVKYALLVIGISIFSAIFLYLQNLIMAKINAKIGYSLRKQISQKINKLPLKYLDNQSYGDIMSRITNDVDVVRDTLNQTLSAIVTSVITLVGILIMMFITSWKLSLISILFIPINLLCVTLVVKFSQKYFVKKQKSLGAMDGHIEEVFTNQNLIKMFNMKQQSIEKFNKNNDELYISSNRSQFLSGLIMPIMNFVKNVNYLVVAIVGGAMALGNPVFIASVITFIIYSNNVNTPINQLASVANELQSTVAAAERIFEFLEEPEDKNDFIFDEINNFKGEIEFKNVNFGYIPEKQIIFNFNAKIKSGSKVALVGKTGAGKTTMVNLLMRFYNIDSGDILIDNQSILQTDKKYIRSLFGMVLQDSWLFEGTIKENLRYGNNNVTDEDIKKVCILTNADHIISTLPKGYDTIIDDKCNLSSGEKQLLTIARAMLQNAPMLILDEATSSVDTRMEINIQNAMDNLMKNRTSFVIAHRLSTIKNADLILVMDNGNIVEMGTHDELLKNKSYYYNLYNSQFNE